MPLSSKRPPPRICATPLCRNVVGNMSASAGLRRCEFCVKAFARSTPAKVDAELVQGTLFAGKERPAWAKAVSVSAPPVAVNDVQQMAPAPPTTVTEVQRTNEATARLRAAAERAAADWRAAKLLELRRAGVRLEDALAQIEGKEDAP